jgi:hypothetical protein
MKRLMDVMFYLIVVSLFTISFFGYVGKCYPAEKQEEKKEMSVAVGLYTWHFDSENANNFNRLLAFSYDNWCIGWFNNSHYNETIFGGYAFRTDKYKFSENEKWFVRGNAYLGIVYGYGDDLPNVGGISPFALPTGEIGYGRYSLEIGVIPAPGAAGYVTGMFKVSF